MSKGKSYLEKGIYTVIRENSMEFPQKNPALLGVYPDKIKITVIRKYAACSLKHYSL